MDQLQVIGFAYVFVAVITAIIVLLNARHAFLSGQQIALWQVWVMPVLMGAGWPFFWLVFVWVNYIRRSA